MRPLLLALAAAAALVSPALTEVAEAAPGVRIGVKDDAWLLHGPRTLESRVAELDSIGVDIVRFTLRWDSIAQRRPTNGRDPADPAYRWGRAAAVVDALRRRGIDMVLTLVGTPAWANGGRAPNVAPSRAAMFADFAYSAALRFRSVRHWTIWNEPNQARWLSPSSPRVYVTRLLNPAYAAIKQANPRALVAGGVTAPRGNLGGVSPLAWIRGMAAAGADLDAYAHHPYPLRPQETPWNGACAHCGAITMASLERLIGAVRRDLGSVRVWLTEYGYQTNPPDRYLGVSPALQAQYAADAAYRAWSAPYVDMLINFLYQDDVDDDLSSGWQSGFRTATGIEKPALRAFMLPLVQASRSGATVRLWGQVRPRSGPQPYRLQRLRGGRWEWIRGTQLADLSGVFSAVIRAAPGTRVRFWSLRDGLFSRATTIR